MSVFKSVDVFLADLSASEMTAYRCKAALRQGHPILPILETSDLKSRDDLQEIAQTIKDLDTPRSKLHYQEP